MFKKLYCVLLILSRELNRYERMVYGKKTQETIWPNGKSSNEEDFSIHLITSEGEGLWG